MQTGKISRFGLLELSRQRLRPALAETSYITCPRCTGTGHIRSTESAALHILRILEEESMKENTGAVHLQVPVDVGTFLLNEKRADIARIEMRHRINLVIVPNRHLETPQHEIIRLRHDQLNQEGISLPSYQMAEKPVEEAYQPPSAQNEAKPQRLEAAVKGITPDMPAPIVEPKAEVKPQAPQEPGFFAKIMSWFQSSPQAAEPVVAKKAERPPRRERGERSDRGERSERGRGGRGRKDNREEREGGRNAERNAERGGERADRSERKEPRSDQPRQQQPKREEAAEGQSANRRRERPPKAPRAEVVAAAAPSDLPAGNQGPVEGAAAPSEGPQGEGRRRGRRGGRGRGRSEENGAANGAETAAPMPAPEAADAMPALEAAPPRPMPWPTPVAVAPAAPAAPAVAAPVTVAPAAPAPEPVIVAAAAVETASVVVEEPAAVEPQVVAEVPAPAPVPAPAAPEAAPIPQPAPAPAIDVGASLQQAGLVMIETAAGAQASSATTTEAPQRLGRKPKAPVVIQAEPLQMVETKRD